MLKDRLKNVSQKKDEEAEKSRFEDFKQLFSFLKQTVRENKKTGALAVGSAVGFAALSSASPLVLNFLTNSVSSVISTGTMTGVAVGAAVGYGLLEGTNNFVSRFSSLSTRWFCDRFGNKLRAKNTDIVANMPPLVQKKKGQSYLSEVVGRSSSQGKEVLRTSSYAVMTSGSFLISSVLLAAVSLPQASLLLGVTGLKVWANHRINSRFKDAYQKLAKKNSRNVAQNRDILEKMDFIRSNNMQEEEIGNIGKKYQNAQQKSEMMDKKRLKIDALMKAIDFGCSCLITIPAIYTAMKTGNLGSYFLLTGCAYRMLYSGSSAVSSFSEAQERYLSYQESMKELEYDKGLEMSQGTKKIENCRGNIQIKDVSFSYPDQEKEVLSGLNLSVKKGERIALVGKTGCGKSSLVNLLKRDMDVKSGSIELDGVDIRSLSQKDLNDQIAFVPQKPQFLNRSIYENLKCANPDATKEEIDECMKKAGLYDEIMSRKEGYSANPNTLSGGQQQRLAIAQAFLKSAPIVLMDEPTSALDRYTARDVLETILAFGSDKTLIMVSHNPAEIAKSSRVVVLSDGHVIEDGSPVDLIKKKGYFSGLYKEEIDLFQSKNEDSKKMQEENSPKKNRSNNGGLFKAKYARGRDGK